MGEPVLECLRLLSRLDVRSPVLLAPWAHPAFPGKAPRVLAEIGKDVLPSLQFTLREDDPARSVHEAVGRSVVHAFGETLLEVLTPEPFVLKTVVRFLVGQIPPPEAQALQTLGAQEAGFVRTVGGLCRRKGFSEGFLRAKARDSGVHVGGLVRWTATLHGLSLFEERQAPWEIVALRLGFRSLSAFSHFVSRTAGHCPTQLITEPWRALFVRALAGVLRQERGM